MDDVDVKRNNASLVCLAWSQKKIAGDDIGSNDVADACASLSSCRAARQPGTGAARRAEHTNSPGFLSITCRKRQAVPIGDLDRIDAFGPVLQFRKVRACHDRSVRAVCSQIAVVDQRRELAESMLPKLAGYRTGSLAAQAKGG